MTNKTYPQEPRAWQSAIQEGMGMDVVEGRKAYQEGYFPYEELEQWIRETFNQGYSSDFVPALLRNLQGLAAWVYGGGSEPYWPGSDDENEGQE